MRLAGWGRPRWGGADPNLRPWLGVGLKWLDDLDQGGRNNVAVVHEARPLLPLALACSLEPR